MNKLVKTIFMLSLIFVFFSCEEEDDSMLESERVANTLRKVIEGYRINECSIILVYGEQSFLAHNNVDFRIEDGFVIVGGSEYYNLLNLTKFEVFDTGDPITLYFENTVP